MASINSLCVYCGSSVGAKSDYVAGSEALAQAMAARGMSLVYGGAHVGIMGAVANRLMSLDGQVFGVIPEALVKLEVAHEGLTELFVVADMHERKAKMADLSDGFVALPGGLGTFEELFEMLTWAQLGFHTKPVGLLNVAGFYDELLRFLDTACEQGFMKQAHRDILIADTDPDRLLDRMNGYEAKYKSKLPD